MTEHTPPPWKIDGDTIYDQDDNSICVFLDEWEVCRNDEANARHIVRCVNSHDALVKALEGMNQHMVNLQKTITMFLEPGDRRIQTEKELVSSIIYHLDGPEQRKVQTAARAALAAAKAA